MDGFSEGPGEHPQHQLENLFEISLPTPGPSTRGKVPVQPNHWTGLAKDPASILSISWKTFVFWSSLSQHRALQPPGEHHQHQLEKVFAFTLPTPGPSTRGKVPVQPNHWTDLAKDPASIISISWKTFLFLSFPLRNTGPYNPPTSIISISWKTFLSSLSQNRARQPPDKHHQHQLESLFEISLPTPGPSTRSKVPVQPNHWTDLAKDPASIISISWKTFCF